jgi:hypothetical protein
MEDRSWNIGKRFACVFTAWSAFTTTAESPSKRKIVQCNSAIVNCTINRRNRRASDYRQEDQCDKQTQKVSSSFFKLRSSAVPRSLFENGCPK